MLKVVMGILSNSWHNLESHRHRLHVEEQVFGGPDMSLQACDTASVASGRCIFGSFNFAAFCPCQTAGRVLEEVNGLEDVFYQGMEMTWCLRISPVYIPGQSIVYLPVIDLLGQEFFVQQSIRFIISLHRITIYSETIMQPF